MLKACPDYHPFLGGGPGTWVQLKIPAAKFKTFDGLVVLLQAGSIDKPGAILGAARTSLR